MESRSRGDPPPLLSAVEATPGQGTAWEKPYHHFCISNGEAESPDEGQYGNSTISYSFLNSLSQAPCQALSLPCIFPTQIQLHKRYQLLFELVISKTTET